MRESKSEEMREHGRPVGAKAQHELRQSGSYGSDSDNYIRRGGGSDPRRHEAQIAIERVVKNHDQSGYNHNATANQPANGGHENEMYMRQKEAEVNRTPEIQPDGKMGMGPGMKQGMGPY